MKTNSFRIAAAAALALGATNAAAQNGCGPLELLSDPAGDWSGTVGGTAGQGAGLPEQDLLSLSIRQSKADDGEALLTFLIATAGAPLAAPLPAAAWFTSFETPDGVIYGVRLQTDGTGAESFFSYIAGASNAGTIDGRFVEAGTEKPAVAGEFGTDGVISITVKAANIGVAPGQTLGPFNAATTQSTPVGVLAFTVDEAPTALGRDGFFDIQGSCSGKSTGLLGAGALPLLSLLPLLMAGLRRRR